MNIVIKRTILFIAVLVLGCSVNTFAQRTSNYWGVKLSPSLEIPSKFKTDGQSVKMFNNGFDAAIGGVYNINLGSGFYLEPGVQFFEKRYTYNDLIITDKDGNEAIKDPTVYKFGLRVPVVIGYTLFRFKDNMAVDIFTGPELNYAFAGFIKAKDAAKYDFSTDPFGAHGQR